MSTTFHVFLLAFAPIFSECFGVPDYKQLRPCFTCVYIEHGQVVYILTSCSNKLVGKGCLFHRKRCDLNTDYIEFYSQYQQQEKILPYIFQGYFDNAKYFIYEAHNKYFFP